MSVTPRTKLAGVDHPAAQTPMMRQFFAAKEQHPDAILLFRMGDFYETFFDDAEDAASILELTLTSRNKKDAVPIPMAGVPHHAAPGYIRRLLAAGRKVAICEQVEDPRQAKGIVKREVVRVVTPGVILDEEALGGHQNNFLAALYSEPAGGTGIAWTDVSTGEVRGTLCTTPLEAIDQLGRLEPAEVLVSVNDDALATDLQPHLEGSTLTRTAALNTTPQDALAAASTMLRDYIALTQKSTTPPLMALERLDADGHMALGSEAVRNLELVRTMRDGGRQGSLLGLIDKTCTAMGARLLKQWLLSPLLDLEAITLRHDSVEALGADPMLRAEVRDALRSVYDLERLVTRVVAETASPRDLTALANSLARVPDVEQDLAWAGPSCLKTLTEGLDPVTEAVEAIQAALVEAPPMSLKDGGVIREGYHEELDELIAVAREGKSWFSAYAETLRSETGISSLKIRFNSVFGYFMEVTKANLHLVPEEWLRKQTLANCERYYTTELKEREEKVVGADERRVALETELFAALRQTVASFTERIQKTARQLATIDVLSGFAETAQRRGYVRPTLDTSVRLDIVGGRHPVVESLMPDGEFVPNDVSLDARQQQLIVITGPNMSGKSTAMRQVALIVVMAQTGCFVPAESAHIGLVDKVFTRVGASDNLARGQSTFMVEMTETASILNGATARSLLILDEIGRGTSTYDGVSIAWAVAEHLHDHVGARTLFATHYHELTELAATRDRIENMTVAVREWQDEIVFLRRLVPGGTSRSYGIQVARLAGLPASVLERARGILTTLEEHAVDTAGRPHISPTKAESSAAWQLTLFKGPQVPSELLERLETVDPDSLNPRQALNLLYELKALLDEKH